VWTVLLISGKCRHLRENQSYLCCCCHGNQVLRASTNARKKRPFQTLNERLILAKFASPIINETADRQNLTSFTSVQWFRVKKNHRTSYFGHYGTIQKGVFFVFTPVKSGLNVVLHVHPSVRSFRKAFQRVKKVISRALIDSSDTIASQIDRMSPRFTMAKSEFKGIQSRLIAITRYFSATAACWTFSDNILSSWQWKFI
jgi:hypothetical protein